MAEPSASRSGCDEFDQGTVPESLRLIRRSRVADGSTAPRDELVDDDSRLRYLKRIMSEEAPEKDIELLFAIYREHRDDSEMPFPDPDEIPDSIRRFGRKDWCQ